MRSFLIFSVFLLTANWSLAQSPKPTDWGEWWQFRGDRRLTGRARVKGDIQAPPTVLWKQFIGSRVTWIALTPRQGDSASPSLPTEDVFVSSYQAMLREWDVRGPSYDLDGNGNYTQIGPSETDKIGDFLPESPGLEKVHFDSVGPICGTVPGTCGASGFLFRRNGGNWNQLWESSLVPDLFSPAPIVGDFDADGRLEVAVTAWNDIYLFDLQAGTFEQKGTFRVTGALSGRGYGWFGAYDLGGDGKSEFVVLGDFENIISVLGWSGGTLTKLWERLIEYGIEDKKTVHDPGVSPLQDIDGDGDREVVVSIYNETGDNLWHVMAFEGMTGRVLLDLSAEHLDGMADLDGDGVVELLLRSAPAQRLPELTSIRVVGFKGGNVTEHWRTTGTAFQTSQLQQIPWNVNTSAATRWTTVLIGPPDAGNRRMFFTRWPVDRARSVWEVTAWSFSANGGIQTVGTAQGPNAAIIATKSPSPNFASVLLQTEVPLNEPAQYSLHGFNSTVIYSEQNSPQMSSPVVGALAAGGRPSVIVQTSGEHVVALQPDSDGSVRTLWSRPGRGHFTGATGYTGVNGFGGVILADLQGSWNLATLIATSGPAGQARLTALAPDGSEIWSTDFDRFPGVVPQWNNGGLLNWIAGRFRYRDRDDIFVGLRRSTANSEELYFLDGATGNILWSRTGHQGGGWMAVYDWNDDRLEEAINFMSIEYWVVDAAGNNLISRDFRGGVFPGVDAFRGNPIADDFLGNGSTTLLYAGSPYVLGLITAMAEPVWSTPPGVRPPGFTQAIADLNGDGALEVVSIGELIHNTTNQSKVVARSGRTGSEIWSITIDAPPFDANGNALGPSPSAGISADLDGNGREEVIFTAGRRLSAVESSPDGSAGRVVWQLQLPGALGPPAVASPTGDGTLQILVTCYDGFIYGIGAAPPTTPPSNPAPVVTRLLQTSAFAGSPSFNLTVEGSGFTQSSVVRWKGLDRPTTYFNSRQLAARISASDLFSPGTAEVTVFNRPPVGGTSTAVSFTIVGPIIHSGGTVNGASFAAGAPVTAGSIASIFGSNLVSASGAASVRVGSTPAYVFYASPTQINFQVPWEVAGQPQASVVVTANGVSSAQAMVNLAPVGPGIFMVGPSGQGAVLIASTGELAAPAGSIPGSVSRAATRGVDFISIYCTGLGEVANRPASGVAAGGNPLSSTTSAPSVTIGGVSATVDFSGLAPGFVGLYQVNVRVPSNAPVGGAVPVVVSIGGTTSNTATIAVQ